MSNNADYWKKFWDDQATPLHRYNTPEWYALYAKEINLILDALGYNGGPVLETGCGNGALFDQLNINKSDYVGTDISSGLIEIFRSQHPELELACTDSAAYQSEKKFSLIFSNGVIQYFDRSQLDLYVKNSLNMLNENGILLMVNVPDKDIQKKYYAVNQRSSITATFQYVKVLAQRLLGVPGIGNWYSNRDFFVYEAQGLEIQFFGSLFHTYRFTISIKKVPA
jgi:cyclopropane fatty-acyl-phospholipid synthase-like methyltransferase